MNTAPGNEPTIPNLEKPTSEQWRLLIAELVVAMYKLAGPTPPWLPEFPDFDFRVEKVEAEIERLKTCTRNTLQRWQFPCSVLPMIMNLQTPAANQLCHL